MQPVEIRLISQSEILGMNVSIKKIIELVKYGLYEHGLNKVENPPKIGIHGRPNSFIHAMPSFLSEMDIGGIKWVCGYPDNRKQGLPQIFGALILNDMSTGIPICMMDSTWITAVRTAAVSAVTAKYCARKGAEKVGIIGAGVQGKYHLLALNEVLPKLNRVKITDINNEASKKFKKEFESMSNVSIEICSKPKEVAIGSDVIITATQRLSQPIIKNKWFEPGCLGIGLEASRAWHGDAILSADKFITDSWEQTKYYHETAGAFPDGLPNSYTELGKIVAGINKGRTAVKDRILAINIGIACSDIVIADYLFKKANKENIGKIWSLS